MPVNFVFFNIWSNIQQPKRGTPHASPFQIKSFLVIVLAVRVAAGTVLAAVVRVVVRTVL